MKIQKVAFAATAIDSYIYCFGGFDGKDRLNIIEKYDGKLNIWTLLTIKLENPLSNSACVGIDKTKEILLLGGGGSDGFN